MNAFYITFSGISSRNLDVTLRNPSLDNLLDTNLQRTIFSPTCKPIFAVRFTHTQSTVEHQEQYNKQRVKTSDLSDHASPEREEEGLECGVFPLSSCICLSLHIVWLDEGMPNPLLNIKPSTREGAEV